MCENHKFDFGDECDRRYEEQRQEQVDRQARGEFFEQLEMDFGPGPVRSAYEQAAGEHLARTFDQEFEKQFGLGIERNGTG